MTDRIKEKLEILSDAAKYDVSCASSGSKRKNEGGLGNGNGTGICHAYTEDGRCVSLLKILLTNHCIYDCAYCVSRKSNDVKRAAFAVDEVVQLTMNFYRRNYIEGLFLSSGIFSNPDYTMERLVRIAKKLRTEEKFFGYIHLKTIPGASEALIKEAGRWADRLSINIEMPTEKSLALLAPDKSRKDMLTPIKYLRNEIIKNKEEKKVFRSTPIFAPAGQSTQMVIGATPESDMEILGIANYFYGKMNMKRVYYSGYVPVSTDSRLPAIGTPVPVMRENRLYQADWLMRFYGFKVEEIVNSTYPLLDLEIDPKLGWALRNPDLFPVDVNYADPELIKRVPGIGLKSVGKILKARKFTSLNFEHLKKIGIAINKAKYFICAAGDFERKIYSQPQLKRIIVREMKSKYQPNFSTQMQLFL